MISPKTSYLHGTRRKETSTVYVDPFDMYKIIDPHNYLLMTLQYVILQGVFEHDIIKHMQNDLLYLHVQTRNLSIFLHTKYINSMH